MKTGVSASAGTRLTVAAGSPGSGNSQKPRAAGASRIPALRTPARYQTIRDLARLGIIPETSSTCPGRADERLFGFVNGQGQADVSNPQAQDRRQRGKTADGPAR